MCNGRMPKGESAIMARNKNNAQLVSFTLTIGKGGLSEKQPEAQAATVTVQGAAFDNAVLEAAGLAWLQERGFKGTVSNPRVTADGVTADEAGKVAKRKGRVKVVSEQYSGDVWIRDARSTRNSGRADKISKYEAALIAAGIDPATIA